VGSASILAWWSRCTRNATEYRSRPYDRPVPVPPPAVPVPVTPQAEELDDIVAFVAAQQADPARRVSYVGEEAPGIRAELDGLVPPWAETVRMVRDGGRIAGAVVVEWDEELRRAWIVGPWVDGDGDAWTAVAVPLLDAALAQLPASVTRYELCGDVANRRLAGLAASRGWAATEPNHVLVADADVIAGWPADEPGLRNATTADVATIAPLHDAEFPGTYASARQLVDGQLDGSRVVLVADGEGGGLVGYAAGQVHEDGEGFVDFVVVAPSARGTGLGARLVAALGRRLLARASLGRVCLTVQDHRAPARALYARMGFRPDGSLVAYRSWTP
jgi:GNAT superfamily N-acetyltransferase